MFNSAFQEKNIEESPEKINRNDQRSRKHGLWGKTVQTEVVQSGEKTREDNLNLHSGQFQTGDRTVYREYKHERASAATKKIQIGCCGEKNKSNTEDTEAQSKS